MVVKVLHYDAFTDKPGMGNPAGIVLSADVLSDEQMQAIASSTGFNETAFILSSNKADIRIRFFTPGHEMDLCGHATVASVFMVKELGLLKADKILLETNVGLLPISITNSESHVIIGMQHAPYQEEIFTGSLSDLAHSIGLSENDIDPKFPVVFGSTGIWTLLLPVKNIAAFKRMNPQNALFPKILFQKTHSIQRRQNRSCCFSQHFYTIFPYNLLNYSFSVLRKPSVPEMTSRKSSRGRHACGTRSKNPSRSPSRK